MSSLPPRIKRLFDTADFSGKSYEESSARCEAYQAMFAQELATAERTAREAVKEELANKFLMIGVFYATLKNLYGKDIADIVMKRVNENYATAKALAPSTNGDKE